MFVVAAASVVTCDIGLPDCFRAAGFLATEAEQRKGRFV
jgi:hypothetical protein